MSKLLAGLVGLFFFALLASPGPASAAQQRIDGIKNLDQYELSSHRRRYRHRHVRRHYWGPRYGYYYGSPYWRPRYSYYYAAPAPFPFFPFFGPWGW